MVSIPGIGEKTAWIVLLILRSRNFQSASEVPSQIGLNPIEKRSGSLTERESAPLSFRTSGKHDNRLKNRDVISIF
jgi:predicted nucleic acid-binding OB-fold protein